MPIHDIYICSNICIYIYEHIHIYAYTYTHVHTYTYIHTHILMHIHIDTEEIKSREFRVAFSVGKTLSRVFTKEQEEEKCR